MELHGGSLGGLSCSTGINVSKVEAPQPADHYPKRQSRPTFRHPSTQPRVGLPYASSHRRPPLFGRSEVSTPALLIEDGSPWAAARSSRGSRPGVKVSPQRH